MNPCQMDVKKEKTARDGTRVPMKKNSQRRYPRTRKENSQGWDPRTPERKSSANSRQGCGLIVQAREKDAFENPMRDIKVDKLVLNDKVGDCEGLPRK